MADNFIINRQNVTVEWNLNTFSIDGSEKKRRKVLTWIFLKFKWFRLKAQNEGRSWNTFFGPIIAWMKDTNSGMKILDALLDKQNQVSS